VVLLWFVLVAVAFSLFRRFFERPKARFALDGLSGTVLVVLGLKIALG
jgi:arginine exporter protein ArgO